MKALHAFLAVCALWLATLAAPACAQTFTDFSATANVNGVNTKTLAVSSAVSAGNMVVAFGGMDSGVGGFGAPAITDSKGNAYVTDVACAAVGGVESQSWIAHSVLTTPLTTSDTLTYTAAGGATPFGSYKAGFSTSPLAVDGIPTCTASNSGATTMASGPITSKVNGLAIGVAVAKGGGAAWTQASGFTGNPSTSWGNYGPLTSGQQFYTGVQTLNYNPTSTAQPGSASSALVLFRTQALPFNPFGGGLLSMGLTTALDRTLNDGCNQAPAPAAALGECQQVQALRPGEWRTDLIDKGVTYAANYSGYFDQCLGQSGATGTAATTLNGTSAAVGNGSGAYQANMGPGTCKGANLVGFFPGGGAYFQVHASWTAQSVSGTWQAPLWLNGGQCSPLPVVVGCNWNGQQTTVPLTGATYVSATGVTSFTTSSAPSFGAFTSVTLALTLTGTGNFAALEGVSCEALTAISTTTFNLTCPSGLGSLTLTGGALGSTYFHYPEIDQEMFQGNFGDPLGQLQITLHDWGNAAKSANYNVFYVTNPGQSSFSTPHYYGFQWTPAVGSTPGSVCSYYDGTQTGCQTWDQFTNNGVQGAPVDFALSTPFCTYVSGTGVITCTLASSASIVIGSKPHLQISGGTGNTSALDGNWPALAGTTGTTVILQGPTGQGVVTVTGGDIAQSWAFGVADIQNFITYMGCSNTTPCTIDDEEIWQSPTQFAQSLRF